VSIADRSRLRALAQLAITEALADGGDLEDHVDAAAAVIEALEDYGITFADFCAEVSGD
jgi:hypothetical protein